MTLDEIINKLKEKCSSFYEKIKIEEPDMRLINNEIDTLCHSIRREFERYEDDGIFEIDRVYKSTEKIEDLARKIDDYEEEMAEEN